MEVPKNTRLAEKLNEYDCGEGEQTTFGVQTLAPATVVYFRRCFEPL
jgi:hypothetical protein